MQRISLAYMKAAADGRQEMASKCLLNAVCPLCQLFSPKPSPVPAGAEALGLLALLGFAERSSVQ